MNFQEFSIYSFINSEITFTDWHNLPTAFTVNIIAIKLPKLK